MPTAAPMFRGRFARRQPKKVHNWQHDRTTTQRGYGHRWQKLRDAIMRRDGYLCRVCLAGGKYRPATQVDHITPKAHGGTDDPDNLQAICTACHATKTAKESNA